MLCRLPCVLTLQKTTAYKYTTIKKTLAEHGGHEELYGKWDDEIYYKLYLYIFRVHAAVHDDYLVHAFEFYGYCIRHIYEQSVQSDDTSRLFMVPGSVIAYFLNSCSSIFHLLCSPFPYLPQLQPPLLHPLALGSLALFYFGCGPMQQQHHRQH